MNFRCESFVAVTVVEGSKFVRAKKAHLVAIRGSWVRVRRFLTPKTALRPYGRGGSRRLAVAATGKKRAPTNVEREKQQHNDASDVANDGAGPKESEDRLFEGAKRWKPGEGEDEGMGERLSLRCACWWSQARGTYRDRPTSICHPDRPRDSLALASMISLSGHIGNGKEVTSSKYGFHYDCLCCIRNGRWC